MKTIKNDVFLSIEGKPLINDNVELTVNSALKLFIVALPRENLTMNDCVHGTSIFSSLDKCASQETFEISDSDLKWLNEKLDSLGPKIFGLNVVNLVKKLE